MDCIRSASTEALEWAKAICQGEGANVPLESDNEDEARKVTFSIYSKDHLRELFRSAATRQTEIMVQNILGYGIDIPLLGLREASKEVDGEVHELFTDECFAISNCFLLSTSQVTKLIINLINTLCNHNYWHNNNKKLYAQLCCTFLINCTIYHKLNSQKQVSHKLCTNIYGTVWYL